MTYVVLEQINVCLSCFWGVGIKTQALKVESGRAFMHVIIFFLIYKSLAVSGVAAAIPRQPHYILPAHSSQFMQGGGSDQNSG